MYIKKQILFLNNEIFIVENFIHKYRKFNTMKVTYFYDFSKTY